MTYEGDSRPYKEGDAGDIDKTDPSEDPITKLESQCSDPRCIRGIIDRGRVHQTVCPCLYKARVKLWLYLMQFGEPVAKSPLQETSSLRLIIRGSTWATTNRHLACRLLAGHLGQSLNLGNPTFYHRVEVIRLRQLVDAVLRTRQKFAPYLGKVVIIRTTAASPRTKDINADCLHEFLGFAEDNRLGVWLVDEPSERLAPGHRAWSPDVGKSLDEMKFVEVEIEPAPDLDLSMLDRVNYSPPPRPAVPAKPAYVHPDPTVVFPNGAVPTSAVDAAGMLAPRGRGIGSAAKMKTQTTFEPAMPEKSLDIGMAEEDLVEEDFSEEDLVEARYKSIEDELLDNILNDI